MKKLSLAFPLFFFFFLVLLYCSVESRLLLTLFIFSFICVHVFPERQFAHMHGILRAPPLSDWQAFHRGGF